MKKFLLTTLIFGLLALPTTALGAAPKNCGNFAPDGAGVYRVLASKGVSCTTAVRIASFWQNGESTGFWRCKSYPFGFESVKVRCTWAANKRYIWILAGA